MRSFSLIIAASSMLMLATNLQAGDDAKHRHGGKLGHGLHVVKCPQCCHDCVFSAEKAKETKSCYAAECKPICIPRVVFPWQKGCCTCGKGGKDGGKDGCCAVHNGVKKRSVRVLKKYEYECSKCKYQWTPVDDKDGDKDGDWKDEMPAPIPAGDVDVPPPPPVSAQHRAVNKPLVRVVSH
jgi:hypothetical protein